METSIKNESIIIERLQSIVNRNINNALRGAMGLDLDPLDFWSEGLLWEKVYKDLRAQETKSENPSPNTSHGKTE